MFYHVDTLRELRALRSYLRAKKVVGTENSVDEWVRMVATNRLTGHSKGFFSVWTLPPNQAASPARQMKINEKYRQKPEYRSVKTLVLKKSKSLLKDIDDTTRERLKYMGKVSRFMTRDARETDDIESESVDLTVTSPPFLNVVQYAQDNWLRLWFNCIDAEEIGKQIVMAKTVEHWRYFIRGVFSQLFRITKRGGFVAFEVGEVRNGAINLEEIVVDIGVVSGFSCIGIVINEQNFTKTANIWGISNNCKGTNSNRVVLFYKD